MRALSERSLFWVALGALAVVAGCYVLVEATGPLPGELRFETWRLDGGVPSPLDRPLTFVTYLGDSWVAFAIVVVLVLVIAEEYGARLAAVAALAALAGPAAEILSHILGSTSP